jgi:dipeptidyl aminopeptidase/acylaminoacyl peptidase
VGLADGRVRRITNDLNSYQDVGEGAGGAIVTLQSDLSSTVSIATPPAGDLTPVTTGAGRYDGQLALTWTPSGRVIFSSAAGGFTDLWIADVDGRNARQLTSDPAAESDASVTPDGRSVVFVSEKNGRPGIWRLEIDSGRLTQLTDNAADVLPHCLPDGKTVVFSRTESQTYAYRVSLDGGGAARISDQIANTLDVSPDGRFAATFTREIDASKWLIGLVPLDGSRMTQGFDIVTFPLRLRWTSDGAAITYLENRRETQSLWNQPMKGGPPQPLLDLHGEHLANFAWSRDGQLAIVAGKGPTDVVLLSGVQ